MLPVTLGAGPSYTNSFTVREREEREYPSLVLQTKSCIAHGTESCLKRVVLNVL